MRDMLKHTEFMSRHIGERFLDELEPFIDDNIVIPMRRLDNIVRSWEKRQMALKDLYQAFAILVDRYHDRNPFYFPIDANDRDKRLQKLNKKFGLSLETDWRQIGAASKPITIERDEESYEMLHNDFGWLFKEIYGRN